ncbi:hypothetical protein HAL_00100 [Haladaptatus sp. T7]|nr:hypothetical protein HAL_00100 [Haladaptatus sp. T7]
MSTATVHIEAIAFFHSNRFSPLMSDTDDVDLDQFFRDVDKVYSEYDNGYMDADAALSVIDDHLDALRAQVK